MPQRKKYNQYKFDDKFAYGLLSNADKYFIVDIDDYDKIKDIYWYLDSDGYVKGRNPKINRTVKLHKLLTSDWGKGYIDHADRNKLNNSKSNLRVCTQKENALNRNKCQNNKSGFVGVYYLRGKWESYITYNKKQIYLGRYKNKKDAVVARLEAEKKYFGEFAPQRHLFEQYGISDGENKAGV